MKNIFRDRRIYSPAIAAAAAVLLVSLTVAASTTISTDISTGGSLTVGTDAGVAGVFQASSTALFGAGLTTYSSSTLQAATVGGNLSVLGNTTLGGGSTITKFMAGTCTLTPGAIAPFATTSTNCSVAAVASGDKVFVTPPPSFESGLILSGATSTSGNIAITVYNSSSTSVTGGAKLWSFQAIR